jgi:hypothetical protein
MYCMGINSQLKNAADAAGIVYKASHPPNKFRVERNLKLCLYQAVCRAGLTLYPSSRLSCRDERFKIFLRFQLCYNRL